MIGDSTARQTYWGLVRILSPNEENTGAATKHADIVIHSQDIRLDFIWDPYLNGSGRQSLENLAIPRPITASHMLHKDLVVIGSGLWHARHFGADAPVKHAAAFDSLTSNIWQNQSQLEPFVMYIMPIQMPVHSMLSPERRASFEYSVIASMNQHLQQTSKDRFALTMSFEALISNASSSDVPDGLHVSDKLAKTKADLILNAHCNKYVQQERGYPKDVTCCASPIYSVIELLVKVVLQLLRIYFSVVVVFSLYNGTLKLGSGNPLVLEVVLILITCITTDRASKYTAREKTVRFDIFLNVVLVIFGLVLMKSGVTARVKTILSRSEGGDSGSQAFSRDLTDEWKGWMQFVILAYHYTGTSKELVVYQPVRVMVAAYLFLTGYGHTIYFLNRQDFSYRRLVAVLIRLNLLSCILPYLMRTEYIFYYFAPLSSFWFLVVYLTLRFKQETNSKSAFVVKKILIATVITSALLYIPGIIEGLFSLLLRTCNIHWNPQETRFRFGLDPLVVYAGMLYALYTVRYQCYPTTVSTLPSHSLRNTLLSTLFNLIVIVSYFFLARWFLPTKTSYNAMHPFISIIPILAYIALRNQPVFRSQYSAAFAWLGRCSLETFTLQYHIWLTGDTKLLLGLPQIGRSRPRQSPQWLEFAVLTSFFVCSSWAMADATNVVVRWFVNGNAARKNQSKIVEHACGKDFEIQERERSVRGAAIEGMGRAFKSISGRLMLMLLCMWTINRVSALVNWEQVMLTNSSATGTVLVYGSSSDGSWRAAVMRPKSCIAWCGFGWTGGWDGREAVAACLLCWLDNAPVQNSV